MHTVTCCVAGSHQTRLHIGAGSHQPRLHIGAIKAAGRPEQCSCVEIVLMLTMSFF